MLFIGLHAARQGENDRPNKEDRFYPEAQHGPGSFLFHDVFSFSRELAPSIGCNMKTFAQIFCDWRSNHFCNYAVCVL